LQCSHLLVLHRSLTDFASILCANMARFCAIIANGEANEERSITLGADNMIVKEIMTAEIITVAPDDTLSHAANLLRQHQFHHLPVVRGGSGAATWHWPGDKKTPLVFEGLLTSQDIDMAVALDRESNEGGAREPWQSRRVVEIMHRALIRVTPGTSVAAAALLLVERALNCLPVIQYEATDAQSDVEQSAPGEDWQEGRPLLVGLLTRSDLLTALARSLGVFEPGMQLTLPLRHGNMQPLARALALASELHIQVRSVVAAPLQGTFPRSATLRLGTINPAPFLLRLQEEQIQYAFADQDI
jgi:acetoin utilization protein AcuB